LGWFLKRADDTLIFLVRVYFWRFKNCVSRWSRYWFCTSINSDWDNLALTMYKLNSYKVLKMRLIL
jgi:hypothetical protein